MTTASQEHLRSRMRGRSVSLSTVAGKQRWVELYDKVADLLFRSPLPLTCEEVATQFTADELAIVQNCVVHYEGGTVGASPQYFWSTFLSCSSSWKEVEPRPYRFLPVDKNHFLLEGVERSEFLPVFYLVDRAGDEARRIAQTASLRDEAVMLIRRIISVWKHARNIAEKDATVRTVDPSTSRGVDSGMAVHVDSSSLSSDVRWIESKLSKKKHINITRFCRGFPELFLVREGDARASPTLISVRASERMLPSLTRMVQLVDAQSTFIVIPGPSSPDVSFADALSNNTDMHILGESIMCRIRGLEYQASHRDDVVDLVGRLQTMISKFFTFDKAARVELFGSWLSRLASPRSDVDLSLSLTKKLVDTRKTIYVLANLLESRASMESVQPVPYARIPIVKFVDPKTNLDCDLSLNNILAVHKSRLLGLYITPHGSLGALVRVVKVWAKARGVCSARHSYFNSFGLSLMVMQVVQDRLPETLPPIGEFIDYEYAKRLFTRAIPEVGAWVNRRSGRGGTGKELFDTSDIERRVKSVPLHLLPELLLYFFFYYAHVFDTRSEMVCPRLGRRQVKHRDGWLKGEQLDMVIEDPVHTSTNVARSIRPQQLIEVLDEFKRGYHILATTHDLSLLLEESKRARQRREEDEQFKRNLQQRAELRKQQKRLDLAYWDHNTSDAFCSGLASLILEAKRRALPRTLVFIYGFRNVLAKLVRPSCLPSFIVIPRNLRGRAIKADGECVAIIREAKKRAVPVFFAFTTDRLQEFCSSKYPLSIVAVAVSVDEFADRFAVVLTEHHDLLSRFAAEQKAAQVVCDENAKALERNKEGRSKKRVGPRSRSQRDALVTNRSAAARPALDSILFRRESGHASDSGGPPRIVSGDYARLQLEAIRHAASAKKSQDVQAFLLAIGLPSLLDGCSIPLGPAFGGLMHIVIELLAKNVADVKHLTLLFGDVRRVVHIVEEAKSLLHKSSKFQGSEFTVGSLQHEKSRLRGSPLGAMCLESIAPAAAALPSVEVVRSDALRKTGNCPEVTRQHRRKPQNRNGREELK